jgi:hypothetical protein
VSCYLPELMDLRFPGQFSSLRHSAFTLVFSADLEPNLTTLLLSSKKPLKTVL